MQKQISNLSKYKKIFFSILLVNIVLVSTHKGEFWPFSIFPMFSQAGNPWTRGVVRKVEDIDSKDLWQTKRLSSIENKAVALDSIGANSIDYANFISKTENWSPKRIQGLRDLLKITSHPNSKWIAARTTGHLTDNDSLIVEAIPYFLITADTTYKNPKLFNN